MNNYGLRPVSRKGFEIAIICALPRETHAVLCSLDEIWDDRRQYYGKGSGDDNAYDFGRIGEHPVVIVTLPSMGKVKASSSARSLKMSFSSIRLALLVGICGAVPFKKDNSEIVLGDVVMSEVIVELDYGRQYTAGFKRKDTIIDVPGRPNEEILALLNRWKTPVLLQKLRQGTMNHLTALLQKSTMANTTYPGPSEDKLFSSDYIHKHHRGCEECNALGLVCDVALKASCSDLQCDYRNLVTRRRLEEGSLSLGSRIGNVPTPEIHFGSIGTADTVMKSAQHRDQYAESENVIAFEMEGAGVWDKFNCLIIKGVCDYADSHKNKNWQDYAAAVAASVAKEVLMQYVSPGEPSQTEAVNGRFTEFPQRISDLFTEEKLDNPRRSSQISISSYIQPPPLRDEPAPYESLPKDLVNKVIKDFEKHFHETQFDRFRKADSNKLKRLLKKIQDEQDRSKSLRNLQRIERFLHAVEYMSSIIEKDLGMSEVMCFIWGPVITLLQVAKDHPDWLEALLSAYDQIGDELPILQNYNEMVKCNVGLQRILVALFSDILELHQWMMKLYSGRALKEVFRSLWKDFGNRFAHILFRMRSRKSLLEDRTTIQLRYPGQCINDTQDIRDHILKMQREDSEFDEKERIRQEKKFNEVRDWLASPDIVSGHHNICHDRGYYPNTGDWILSNEKVKQWLSEDSDQFTNSTLWINGRPGTGKTYLASTLIETCKSKDSWNTVYFYCSQEGEGRNTANAIFSGILFQLVRQQPDLVAYCYEKMKTSDTPMLSVTTAETLLNVFFERVPHLYVIIDAIDECESNEQRKFVFDIFKKSVSKCDVYAPGKLRLLYLSQPRADIKNSLSTADTLALTPQHNEKDIQRYCQHRARELGKFEFSSETLKDVVEIICSRANGMFLFAKLVMNNLAKQPTRRRFAEEITKTKLPSELNQAYTRIMERLKKDLGSGRFKYTQLLLGWLVCSKRPLKWTEVQVALSVEIDASNGFDEVDVNLRLQDDIQEICGSLVQVLQGDRVELVHSTARSFISEHSEIKIAAAECDLLVRCLRYLTLNIFRSDVSDEELRRCALRGDFAFQDYAVYAWFLHIQTIVERKQGFLDGNTIDSDRIAQMAYEFDHFTRFYQDSFPEDDILDQSVQKCEFFSQYSFHDNLVKIWNHIFLQQNKEGASLNDVSIGALKETLSRNRVLLESLSAEEGVDITEIYGGYIFRCPKVLCFYFHEGFKSDKARNDHVNCHERPFHCTVENCTIGGMGFKSKNALEKHMRNFHSDQCDLSESFVTLTRRLTGTNARWSCPYCDKSFVRRLILDDHIRTHTGEKPFVCSECGRPFARKYDMKRHEKIHDRRR